MKSLYNLLYESIFDDDDIASNSAEPIKETLYKYLGCEYYNEGVYIDTTTNPVTISIRNWISSKIATRPIFTKPPMDVQYDYLYKVSIYDDTVIEYNPLIKYCNILNVDGLKNLNKLKIDKINILYIGYNNLNIIDGAVDYAIKQKVNICEMDFNFKDYIPLHIMSKLSNINMSIIRHRNIKGIAYEKGKWNIRNDEDGKELVEDGLNKYFSNPKHGQLILFVNESNPKYFEIKPSRRIESGYTFKRINNPIEKYV